MIIAALKESGNRVAITPLAVKHYLKLGFEIACESNAGLASGFKDKDYQAVGVTVFADKKSLLAKVNTLLCVHEPSPSTLGGLSPGTLIIAPVNAYQEDHELVTWCRKGKMNLFSMNHIPRLSRAQALDSLSSQANLAGYRAVIEGIQHFKRAIPMMMTAAGVIQPAKVLVLGAGVAGLQAIATAKRLGAIVYAFDVRSAAKEQVESLGAEFIEVSEKDNETLGGYATEMDESYRRLQGELIARYAKLADIIIATALIPGKKAPLLISQKTVEEMKAGSVIVDLAVAQGGNCELSKPNKIIHFADIIIVGNSTLADLIPATASELYANNLVNLLRLLAKDQAKISFNKEDEIIQQALLCYDGRYLPFKQLSEIQ